MGFSQNPNQIFSGLSGLPVQQRVQIEFQNTRFKLSLTEKSKGVSQSSDPHVTISREINGDVTKIESLDQD